MDHPEHDSPRRLLMLHNAKIQVVGDAKLKRACMAAENVDVAAGHSKMLAVLVVGPRERSWRTRQVRASVVEKLRTAWARLRAIKPSVCDRSAKRFAQSL